MRPATSAGFGTSTGTLLGALSQRLSFDDWTICSKVLAAVEEQVRLYTTPAMCGISTDLIARGGDTCEKP